MGLDAFVKALGVGVVALGRSCYRWNHLAFVFVLFYMPKKMHDVPIYRAKWPL